MHFRGMRKLLMQDVSYRYEKSYSKSWIKCALVFSLSFHQATNFIRKYHENKGDKRNLEM